MLLVLGLLGYIYALYLVLPQSRNVTPLLIRLASLFLVLQLINIAININYIQNEILFLDGVHRLNTNILFYEMLLISLTLLLFQVYTYYLKSSETFMIIFTNVIAIINLIESYDWLLTIINYELINITLYLIVSMKNGSEKALSASIKYFLLSALTTTFLLLFITLIYAITGTIHWDNMGLLWIFIENDIKLPLFFMLITIFFKIAAAPFHNWSPDLLDAIPTVLTSWMATIPKYGILLFLSLFSYFLTPMNFFILFIGNLSILVGSLGLSNQWRIKRFLAYSAITNIGFLLLALGTNQLDYYVYYLIIYALTTIGIFMILLSIENNPEMILQLSGLYHQNAYLGLSFTFLLFSLMGIPPMAGFFAKLMVLASTINLGYISLALFAIVGSIISSVNYLNLIKIINVNLPNQYNTFTVSKEISYYISIIIAFTVLFLFYPLNLLSLSNLLLFIN
uniref:NADH-ubiquinone oxidoreductase chain 2 n=1 Tax=Synchytrium microbalum TaxID=1806994 RepID=A0A4P8NQ87_9FUNG|nr:NADH dehydrogenase subunit 2 [Synchytrium microbalum]QCQ69011.1 NADH dehydrogenase subunit 2 [Synchytrium microbalum]